MHNKITILNYRLNTVLYLYIMYFKSIVKTLKYITRLKFKGNYIHILVHIILEFEKFFLFCLALNHFSLFFIPFTITHMKFESNFSTTHIIFK
jgi:hypothetical protein